MEHFTPSEAPIHETQRLPVLPPRQIIGRNKELGQTFAQLRAGAAVLLHGPNGIGKSALAATIASAFTTFKGGVLWWTVNNVELLKRQNRPLIVLDGALHSSVAREFVRKLASGVPLVLTSQHADSGPWTPIGLPRLGEEDTINLFMQEAQIEQVSSVMKVDIQGVCNALDGLPLALKLAGRHIRVHEQTPGEFLGSLTHAGMEGDIPGLHSVVHQLPDGLQGMLSTIGATFAGQATTMLLEYMHLSPTETVDRVSGMLAARGLVQRIPSCEPITCYNMHEAVHLFMQDWLRDTMRLETHIDRVNEGMRSYVDQYGSSSHDARRRLIAEMPNIMGLAQYSAAQQDRSTLVRLITSLENAFGDSSGYGYELSLLHQMVEQILIDAGNGTPIASQAEATPDIYDTPPVDHVADTPSGPPPVPLGGEDSEDSQPEPYYDTAVAAEALGHQDRRTAVFTDLLKASEVARQSGDRAKLAGALYMLGQAWLDSEQSQQAQAAFSEALTIYEEQEDSEGLINTLEALAELSLDEQDLEGAVVHATRAENLASRGNAARHGHLLALLGDIRLELGELNEAIATYIEAIEVLQSNGDEVSLGIVKTKLGSAHLDRADYTKAIAMLSSALEIFEQEELTEYQGRVVGNLGAAYGNLGQWPEAEGYHKQALEIAREYDDVEEQERQLANLAYAAQTQGDRDSMLHYYRIALGLAYRVSNVNWQIRYLDVLGKLLMDDVTSIRVAVMLLEEAEKLAPSQDRARWLRRAQMRAERIATSDIAQTPAPASIRVWATAQLPDLD